MYNVKELIVKYPILDNVIRTKEVFWNNPKYLPFIEAYKNINITDKDILDAYNRIKRFESYIRIAFPETIDGKIESPLKKIPNMKEIIQSRYGIKINGDLLLKCDNELPISGSIKARGGIYEVLQYAETLALKHNLIELTEDYARLNNEDFRKLFANYKIAVGSTGNLGLSIGIISAKLGFKVYVHMSRDAKKWKKDLLRSKGVMVIEYDADYSVAVKQGRLEAQNDPLMYFIDDENSKNLFLGYAVSSYHIKQQLEEMNIIVNPDNPLHVYLPCGVGGGPGGVAFGLKLLYQDNVHCYFAEPTHSPCMLVGLATGLHDKISVQDITLDNKTIADGLAVGRPSGCVGRLMDNLISGVYTISDDNLLNLLKDMIDTENIKLEPSALAGLYGVVLKNDNLKGTHIAWATGGGMVPDAVMNDYYYHKN